MYRNFVPEITLWVIASATFVRTNIAKLFFQTDTYLIVGNVRKSLYRPGNKMSRIQVWIYTCKYVYLNKLNSKTLNRSWLPEWNWIRKFQTNRTDMRKYREVRAMNDCYSLKVLVFSKFHGPDPASSEISHFANPFFLSRTGQLCSRPLRFGSWIPGFMLIF